MAASCQTQNGIAPGAVPSRDNAYAASRDGRRFYATNPVGGTPIAAQATLVKTTPTLTMHQLASAHQLIIRSLLITVTSDSANPVNLLIVTDSISRVAVGGTLVTPKGANTQFATASALTAFRVNGTVAAPGGTEREMVNDQIALGKSQAYQIDFKDGIVIGATGAFLVYVFDSAGLVAPSIFFDVEWAEVPV